MGDIIHQFHRKFWALFCSMRLAIVILTLLGLALFVGMFWDQTLALDEHLAGIRPDSLWMRAFIFLELNDVFHSWWFGILVLLLALNLTGVSLDRLPRIWIDIHQPHTVLDDNFLSRLQLKKIFTASDATAIKNKLRALFPKEQWTPGHARGDNDSTWYLFGQRHKYARTGVYIIHTSLLLIMFGSIAATTFGTDGMMMIAEGESTPYVRVKGPGGVPYFHGLDFNVRCADFRLKTFTDGSPMAFESDLEVVDAQNAETILARKTIKVNDPLQYGGFTFYQSSYQNMPGEESVRLAIAPHGGEKVLHTVRIGDKIALADSGNIMPVDLVEDYAGLGAAVKVQHTDARGQASSFYVFRQYPEFDPQVRRGHWDVYFMGTDALFATGVSVGRAPGVNAVFLGCALMIVGLYMAFVMNQRRYWGRVKMLADGRVEVALGGQARRHQTSFAEEFEQLCAKVEQC